MVGPVVAGSTARRRVRANADMGRRSVGDIAGADSFDVLEPGAMTAFTLHVVIGAVLHLVVARDAGDIVAALIHRMTAVAGGCRVYRFQRLIGGGMAGLLPGSLEVGVTVPA